jgi:hypothetical protein
MLYWFKRTHMKARLLFWRKAHLYERYLWEVEIYQIEDPVQYASGIKYSLIFIDLGSGRRVLMDNHHPKGPHVHIDEKEFSYAYVDRIQLLRDFHALVLEYFGVKI